MVWHINPSVSLDEKKIRAAMTAWYGQATFVSCLVFLVLICLVHTFLPHLSFSNRSLVAYNSRKPSRVIALPLKWIVCVWILGLLYLIFADTQQEFVYLAKRLGRVSVALFPAIYFLSLKPTPLPRTFYLQLIPLHKWLSRLMVTTLVAHAIVYLGVYIKMSKLGKLLQLSNISGIVAFLSFILIGLSSLKAVRRRCYDLFFSIHYTVSWVSLPMIWYHSNTSQGYMIIAGLILLGQAIYRISISTHLKLPVQYVSPSLFFISIPRSDLPKSLQNFYSPGSHIRLSNPLYQISTWFQSSHPYTIASLPTDPMLTLVVRKTKYPIKLRKQYAITGPYSSIPNTFFGDANTGLVHRALFVAGGSGIAFVAPIMRHLRAMNIPVKLLWAIRDSTEVSILSTLGLSEAALGDGQVEVYVTRGYGEPLKSSISSYIPNDDEDLNVYVDEDCCGGEFQRLLGDGKYASYDQGKPQASDYSRIMFNTRPVLNLRIKSWLYGIPVDSNSCCCLDQLMGLDKDTDKTGLWVLASGAETLARETQTWAKTNGFSFLKDEFSL